jgi:hypothetical protein
VQPKHLTFDDVDNLAIWEQNMRMRSIQMDIFSELKFETLGNETLGVIDRSGAAPQMLLTITRPNMAEFVAQISLVQAYSDLRMDRASEILAQVGEIMSFIGQPLSLHPQRHRWTMEFLFAAVGGIIEVYKRIKHSCAVRRPYELSPQIQPMITTPAHSAFPSGHAMEAFAMAEVLARIVRPIDAGLDGTPNWRQQMQLHATRVAVNRTVAGVHYPLDTMAGALVGRTLADYVMARVEESAQVQPRAFRSPYLPEQAQSAAAQDFNLHDFAVFVGDQPDTGPAPADSYYSTQLAAGTDPAVPFQPAPSKTLKWLFDRAQEEWAMSYELSPVAPEAGQ